MENHSFLTCGRAARSAFLMLLNFRPVACAQFFAFALLRVVSHITIEPKHLLLRWWRGSSRIVAAEVFQENRAVPLLVICQPKSLLLRKLCDLGLPILFSYRPDALQFLLVDSAVPQIVSLELQLTIMCVGFTT